MKNIIIVILLVVLVGGGWLLLRPTSEEPIVEEPVAEEPIAEEPVVEVPEEEIIESETYNYAGQIVKIYQKDGKRYLDVNFIKFLLFVDDDGNITETPAYVYGEQDGDCEPGPNPYCIVDTDKTIYSYEISADAVIIPSSYPGTPIPYEQLEESLMASPFFRIQIEDNIIKRMHQLYIP